MEEPLVSIVVPVYGAEDFISECLESICRQSYSNLEILLIDDGSPDQCGQICETAAQNDKRIKVYHIPNQGVSAARNRGLQAMTGDYVLFVDSDDWIDRDTVRQAVEIAEENEADLVFWPYIREFENRSSEKTIFEGNRLFEGNDAKKLHRRMMGIIGEELRHPENADSLCTVWGKLYRRELICHDFVSLTEIGTYEDGLFNLTALENVRKAFYIDHPFYHYRKLASSQTNRYQAALFSQWEKLYCRLESYLSEKECSAEYQTAYYNRITLNVLGLGLNLYAAPLRLGQKCREMKKILHSKRYQEAFLHFSLRGLPLHWKVFYFFVKQRWAFGVYALCYIIKKLK